jgi:predicted nuclease of predicted toxin-antitoxin system
MRILIDECLDWRLGRGLAGQDCVSVQKMGWSGIKNGKLLTLAQEEFDVFLTADRNLSFQQNTTKFQIAVVVLVAGSTQLNKPLLLMPKVLALLPNLKPGQVEIVTSYKGTRRFPTLSHHLPAAERDSPTFNLKLHN